MYTGISVDPGVNTVIRRSRFDDRADCIFVRGSGGLIAENRLICGDNGLYIRASGVVIQGNDVGPFGDRGIQFYWCNGSLVEDNYFHDGQAQGIYISNGRQFTMRRNSITRNGGQAIFFEEVDDQDGIPAPTITMVGVDYLEGTHSGDDGVVIEVFSDPEAQAELYLGTAILEGQTWHLDLQAPITLGHNLTASATDASGNTSMLSDPVPGE